MEWGTLHLKHRKEGFTIVELLIVVVVIAILAAITIVSYNGITNRAKDTAILADGRVVASAIEMYRAENGTYPICSGGDGMSCTLASMRTVLVPKYTSALPDNATRPYMYVATEGSLGPAWSIRIYKDSISAYCKTGQKMVATWWSSAPNC